VENQGARRARARTARALRALTRPDAQSHVLDILTSPPELLAESPATRHLTPKREDAFLQDFFAGKVPQ
jgi:hypothetical protein